MEENSKKLSYYSFFTKYSLMEDYGFGSGLISRIFKKILPFIPEEGTFDFILLKNRKDISYIVNSIDFSNIEDSYIAEELNISIRALSSKIAAFGLDHNIYSKFKILELETESFDILLTEVAELEYCNRDKIKNLLSLLEKIEINILSLRKHRIKIGVNLHLTMVTRRILEYIDRVKDLVDLKLNLKSKLHWEKLIKKNIDYIKKKGSIRRFISRHLDLLILEIVEHTSNKGEKYIAENSKDYYRFFYKSMLGGAIIAIFALIKIFFSSSYSLSSGEYAVFFSLNYAICFIIVKQLGGIIATKQPAMTASTIAKHIDKNDNLEVDSIKEILRMVRRVIGSQFISVMGNFLMAFIFAAFLFKIFQFSNIENSLGIDPKYLIKGVMPTLELIGYAAVAGIFLALSGIISGYIDNKIIASQIPFRIKNSRLFFKSDLLANFIKNKGGVFVGNLSLGFFLGTAFLLSYLFPFSIDIRHIAFSSSYFGYSIMSYSFENMVIIKAIIGIMLIGITNLIVSFSITLLLALKSRGAKTSLLPYLIFCSIKDFIFHPFEYLIIRDKDKN